MSGEDRLFLFGCFFILGIVLQGIYSDQSVLIPVCVAVECFLVIGIFLFRIKGQRRVYVNWAILLCAAMVIGALIMGVCTARRRGTEELISYIAGKDCEIQGSIIGIPEIENGGKWRATLKSESIMGNKDLCGVSILLTGTVDPGTDFQLRTGNTISATGRFYLPGAPLNPGEPDMRRIMACRGLNGTLYVGDTCNIHVLDRGKLNFICYCAMLLREGIISTCESTLRPRQAKVLSGMLLGKAPVYMKTALESTGTSHLFAASGLHLGYVVLTCITILAPVRLPVLIKSVIVFTFIWVYAIACGLSASIFRAALMFSFGILPKPGEIKISSKSTLVLASLVMFTVNPYAVFDVGVQLSCFAVLSIIHLYPRIYNLSKPLGNHLSDIFSLSVSAQLGVMPLIVWYFGIFAPIGIVANIPCVILTGMAVLIGLSATLINFIFPPLALMLNTANGFIILILEKIIEFFSRVPLGIFTLGRPGVWLIVLYYLGIIAFGIPRRFRRYLCIKVNLIFFIVLTIALGSVMYSIVERQKIEVVFFAVGQGDAIFIKSTRGKLFLIDGGGLAGQSKDPGRDMILPFFRRRGINHIDVIICTHPHYDHIKGLFAVLDSCSVDLILKPEIPGHMIPDIDYALAKLAKEKNTPVVELVEGGRLDIGDGIKICVLNPAIDYLEKAYAGHVLTDLNALSLVMKLEYREFSLLLTADAGKAQLGAIIDSEENPKTTVLKVPHHGSRDGLSPRIINSIKPSVSVISVGPNPFSHPAYEVVENLTGAGSVVFRTDIDGAVILRTCGKRVHIRSIKSSRFFKGTL
ncbi:MAG: DNA internalization-related competence protein ComEC/Rec2 [Firmicutes bacterium]|nr:DNA internalization-related competence protein ComEC/Rec2 [Bacillota bacterium]